MWGTNESVFFSAEEGAETALLMGQKGHIDDVTKVRVRTSPPPLLSLSRSFCPRLSDRESSSLVGTLGERETWHLTLRRACLGEVVVRILHTYYLGSTT